MPIHQRRTFSKYFHAEPLLHGVLVRISPGYPPLMGRLHTRYSPVRRSPAKKASFLPAAPRLACVKPVASVHPEPGSKSSLYFFLFFLKLKMASLNLLVFGLFLTVGFFPFLSLYYILLFSISQRTLSSFLDEKDCKDTAFISYPPNFFTSFFRKNFRMSIRLLNAPPLSKSGCKDRHSTINHQTFLQLFFNIFYKPLIINYKNLCCAT